jgi:chromosome segregation ATPase
MLQRLFATKGPMSAKRGELAALNDRINDIDAQLATLDTQLASENAAKEELWVKVRPDQNGQNAQYSALVDKIGHLSLERQRLCQERLSLLSRAQPMKDLVLAPLHLEQARKDLAASQDSHQKAIAALDAAKKQLLETESRLADARRRASDLGASVAVAISEGKPIPTEAQAVLGLVPALEAALGFAQGGVDAAQAVVAQKEAELSRASGNVKTAAANLALAEAEEAIFPLRGVLARAAAAQGASFRRIEFTPEELAAALDTLEQ